MTDAAQFNAPEVSDFRRNMQILYRGRKILIGCIAVCVLLALTYLWLGTKYYASVSIVAPTPASSSTSSALSQLGSFASALTGIGVTTSTDFTTYFNLLTSREVADDMAKSPGLLQSVFWKEWDGKSFSPGGIIGYAKAVGRVITGQPYYIPPDGERLNNFIIQYVDIEQDPASTYITVTYEDHDAKFAARFIALMESLSDQIVRNQERVNSDRRIKYLTDQLEIVTNSDQRSAIISLLAAEEQKLMLAYADRYYAGVPVVKAIPTGEQADPNPIIILGIAGIAGILLGLGGVALWETRRDALVSYWNRKRSFGIFQTARKAQQTQ